MKAFCNLVNAQEERISNPEYGRKLIIDELKRHGMFTEEMLLKLV